MPIVKCKICNNKFYTKPNLLKRGWGKFCSAKCQYIGRKNGKTVDCFTCKKETYKTQKALKGSKSKKWFCSKSCQTVWRNSIFIGERHANWKTGEYTYRDKMLRHKIEQICNLCQI